MRSEELLLDSEAYGVMILAYDILHDEFAEADVPCDIVFNICNDIMQAFLESAEYFLPISFYDALKEYCEHQSTYVKTLMFQNFLKYSLEV